MKTLREQLTGKCQHFGGIRGAVQDKSKKCNAGVSYYELMSIEVLGEAGCMCRLPCTGDSAGDEVNGEIVSQCDAYKPLTKEQIQGKIDESDKAMENFKNKISNCCQAPIDESCVIPDGQYAGHGPRFCSKCKQIAYMV